MISAIVLAAGLSTRMKAFKQLLPYGDRTVIEQVVSVLMTCSLDEIIVVSGHRHSEVESTLAKYPVRVAFNSLYQQEMVTSIQCGWSQVDARTNAVMHVLGDQPHLLAPVVQQLAAAFNARGAGIFIPSFNKRRGHPIVIDARYRDEIRALGTNATMRDFMQLHAADIQHLPVESDAILRDMDTPEEYEREIKFKIGVS